MTIVENAICPIFNVVLDRAQLAAKAFQISLRIFVGTDGQSVSLYVYL